MHRVGLGMRQRLPVGALARALTSLAKEGQLGRHRVDLLARMASMLFSSARQRFGGPD